MMTYARKLALLLFTFWVGLVMTVVLVTLQRTHRNLNELRGHLILQRLLQFPQQLLAPQRAAQPLQSQTIPVTSPEGGFSRSRVAVQPVEAQQDSRATSSQPTSLPVAAATTSQQKEAVSRLQRITTTHLQGSDWCYRLETTGELSGYRQFTLTAPARWVLDLPGSWQPQEQKIQHFSKGPVQSIVVGYHPQHLRVVFLLKKGGSIPVITAEAGHWVVKFTALPVALHQNRGTRSGSMSLV